MDLTTFELKEAFAKPGCALCRLRAKGERRYLHSIHYEFVNDSEIRQHLVRALGYCPFHAWLFQQLEQETWGSGLGTGIIYEDLLGHAMQAMETYLKQVNSEADLCSFSPQARWRRNIRHWLQGRGRDDITRLPETWQVHEPCMACAQVEQSEQHFISEFVSYGADAQFRAWFAASDGLCLSHFKRVIEATADLPRVRQFISEVQLAKLKTLHHHLSEYLRKYDWNNRHEPKYPEELESWIRAVAFFAGEKQVNNPFLLHDD